MRAHRSNPVEPIQAGKEKFLPSPSLKQILSRTADLLCRITASETSWIAEMGSDGTYCSTMAWISKTQAGRTDKHEFGKKVMFSDAGDWAAEILRLHPYIQNRSAAGVLVPPIETVFSGEENFMVVPVARENRPTAIFAVGRSSSPYTAQEAEILSLFAGVAWDFISCGRQTELYENLINITNDWETWVDKENAFRYCSSNCEMITGYSCADFERDPGLYLEMVHPEDRQAVIDHFAEMHSIHEPYSTVFRIKTKNGEERWIELYCRPFFDSDGKYLGRRGSNRDITGRKLLELQNERIKESLEISQRIAHVGSYEANLKSGKISLSKECLRILGLPENGPPPDLEKSRNLVHPDDVDFVTRRLTTCVTKGEEFNTSFRIIRPDGEVRFVQNIGKPEKSENNLVISLFGIIQDVTEIKLTESKLLDSEARFRGILENASSMAVQGYSPDGTVQYWNQASTNIYGYQEEEALGKNLVDLIIPPEIREEVKAAIKSMAETGQPIPSAELSLMHKDGSRVDVFSSHTIVHRLNHEPELFCIDMSLAQHKQIEAALRESESKYRSLVESITDILFSIKEDGTLLYISPSALAAYGLESAGAIGHSFLDFLHPDDIPMVFSYFDRLINTGERIEGLEFRIKSTNGTWEWHSTTANLQTQSPKGERVIIGITRNISASKLSEQIRNAEVEIMNICHFAKDKRSLLRELVEYFKNLTGVDAVGVRLHEEMEFPYFSVQGFSDEFLDSENSICLRDAQDHIVMDENGLPVLDCICGHVFSRRINIDESSFTKFGSFVSNNTSELAASIKKSRKWGHIRNNCNRFGYESVALIPLQARGNVFGLFQFNDRRRDFFSTSLVQQLENLVDYVSLALANFESTEALRDSEEKYRILVENASEAICVLQEGQCQFCNPKMLETCGFPPNAKPKKHFMEMIHPDDRKMVEVYQLERLQGLPSPSSIICRLVRESGEIRWIELSSAPISWAGKPATFNFMSDITDRKNAQDALRNSEIQLRDMIDNFDGAIWAVDRNFKLINFNSTYQTYHRKVNGREAAVGDDLHVLTQADEHTNREWQEIHARVMQGEQVLAERKINRIEGIEYIEASYSPIRNSNNEVIGVSVIIRDITERKRGEDERRALEERFYNAFHTSPDSISINSIRDGLFVDVNEGFSEMTGYTPEEVIGKSAMEVNLWADPRDREKMIRGLMDRGEVINLETPITTKDGQTKICLMSAKIVEINGEACNLMIVRDISERKAAEAKLNEQIEELRRWHAVTLGRETRIIELKNEVNELLVKAGKPPKYAINGEP